eukprot:Nitzschia sp. Nitz4//scaffold401_size10831//1277//2211//NITZ4_009056-RA/size10831-snap-gene-0.21-mRNA-1//1//CDS//3329551063//1088//frame0
MITAIASRQQHWHQRCLSPLKTQKRCISSSRICLFSDSFSTEDTSGRHIDKWFRTIVKTPEFYERHAESDIRRYFYNVDLQGRLFLEETLPKNIATSIKDDKFLNFFFSRVQHCRPKDEEFLDSEGILQDYPYVSLCGKEINFIRPAATPIVFHSFTPDQQNLCYGGTLMKPFDSKQLFLSSKSGRLYHKLGNDADAGDGDNDKKTKPRKTPSFALVRSAVAVAIAEHIQPSLDDSDDLHYVTQDTNHAIPWLPLEHEPGDHWSFPGDDE